MLDIGMQELIIIFVVALVVFGPRKLPELAKTLGRGVGELKRAMYGIRHTLEEADRSLPPVDKIGDFTLTPQQPDLKESEKKQEQPHLHVPSKEENNGSK